MNLDFEDIVEACFSFVVLVLFLNADVSIVVKLEGEQNVIRWFNFQIVALTKRVNYAILALGVLDNSTSLVSNR